MKKLTKAQKRARVNKKKINKLYEKTKQKIVGKKQEQIIKIWESYREKKHLIKHPIKQIKFDNEIRIILPIIKIGQHFNFTKTIQRCFEISKQSNYVSLTMFTEVQKNSEEFFTETYIEGFGEVENEVSNIFYTGISQTYTQAPINKLNFKDAIEYFFNDYLKKQNTYYKGGVCTGKLRSSQIRLYYE